VGVGEQKVGTDSGGKYFYEVKVSEYKNQCIYFEGRKEKSEAGYKSYCVSDEFKEKLINISFLFLDRPEGAF